MKNQHSGMSAQRRLRSGWAPALFMRTAKTLIRLADAQADLSLRWAHMPCRWFCHEAAQISLSRTKTYSLNNKMGHIIISNIQHLNFSLVSF